jgi:hypothetical protein
MIWMKGTVNLSTFKEECRDLIKMIDERKMEGRMRTQVLSMILLAITVVALFTLFSNYEIVHDCFFDLGFHGLGLLNK